MDKVLRDRVMVIAQQVRDWAQAKADRADYHPDNLMGWCAISSAQLFRRLKDANIDAEIHMWDGGHAYVVVNDYVVDVTATQFPSFRNTPIVIMHTKEAEAYEIYNSTACFRDPKALRDYQKKNRWPSEQIAYTR